MKVTVLSGGVGGAKLCYGLYQVLSGHELSIVVNTGDDAEFYGLYVSPDTDSVLYALAGLEGEQGWGIRNDSFHAIETLRRYGEDVWFNVGDRDLATHLHRTALLRQGRSLSQATLALCRCLGVGAAVRPMSDDRVRTRIISQGRSYDFQEYMVKHRAEPPVERIVFSGSDAALPAPGVTESLTDADLVILAPSNPLVSIGAILAVPGVRRALLQTKARIGAVSPIVAGKAIKGPAARMLQEAGLAVSPLTVSRLYRDFLDLFIADRRDSGWEADFYREGQRVCFLDTLMPDADNKIRLAGEVLQALAGPGNRSARGR